LQLVEQKVVARKETDFEIASALVQLALPKNSMLPSTITALKCTRGHTRISNLPQGGRRSPGNRRNSSRNGRDGGDACRMRISHPRATCSSKARRIERYSPLPPDVRRRPGRARSSSTISSFKFAVAIHRLRSAFIAALTTAS
jgi:hypothetical protein